MMNTQLDVHGIATALRRAVDHAAAAPQAQVEPRSPRRLRLLLLQAGEQGQALVEFALILPALMLITTGIMIFGYAMNNYLQLTNAVSVGARTVAISAGITRDPCSVASSAVIAAAPGLNPALLKFSYNFNGTTTTGASCSCSSVTSSYAGDLSSGNNVTVTATYPFALSVYAHVFSQNNAVFEASSTELVQ